MVIFHNIFVAKKLFPLLRKPTICMSFSKTQALLSVSLRMHASVKIVATMLAMSFLRAFATRVMEWHLFDDIKFIQHFFLYFVVVQNPLE